MARTSAPHSATAQFFINAADNALPRLQVRDAAGLGLCRVRQGRQGQRRRRRDRAGAHRQPGRPRRRAARRRDDHRAPPSFPEPRGRGSAGRPGFALPLPEATPTLACAAAWRAIDFISDLHLAASTPRHLRRLGGAPAGTAAPTRSSSSATCSRSGSATTCAERDFEARCTEVLGEAAAAPARSPSWPATATSWSATRCSSRCGVHAPARPDAARRLRRTQVLVSHGDALCLGDVAYQRFRRIVRRPGVQRAFLALPLTVAPRASAARRAHAERAHKALGPRPCAPTSTPTPRAAGCARRERHVLVHGHTHRPASHALAPGLVRHVLSDWDLDGAGTRRAPRCCAGPTPASPASRRTSGRRGRARR